MAGFGLQSIIVVILGVIILSILVLRIRTSSSSPSQVSTIFQSSQNNDLVDNPELLAVNNNVSPLPVSSPSFSPLSGMDYFGRNWNWPLVVIILMIAVFLIWLIGYALMGKTPTGNTTNNNNNNNSISNNNSKLTATINTHTNSSSTFTTTTTTSNNNSIPSTFTSTINNSTTTISAPPTPVIVSSATSTITPSVPSFTSTPNPSFTPIPPVPSNPPINSSSSSSSSTINRTSSSYLGQTISSVGTSTFNVPPDQIQLTLHLEATAPSDLEARDSINALLSDLRTALQQSGVPSADIQIGNISILPSYPNSLLNLISATSQESQNNQVSLPSSLYQNASSLSSPSYSSSDNNNNNNNNNRRKKRIKQNKKEEDQENNNNMYSSSNCTTPSPYYQHGGINSSNNTQQNNFNNLINPQYTNSTVSIPPTAVTAIAEVQVYTLMNRVNLNALLSAAANNSSQFNVIFSLSDTNQSQQKATALLLARQNATDNAFVQAQNLRLQLGGMIDEYVAPDGVSIYPIVVNNSQDISSLFNNEKSVKVVATVNNTYAIS